MIWNLRSLWLIFITYWLLPPYSFIPGNCSWRYCSNDLVSNRFVINQVTNCKRMNDDADVLPPPPPFFFFYCSPVADSKIKHAQFLHQHHKIAFTACAALLFSCWSKADSKTNILNSVSVVCPSSVIFRQEQLTMDQILPVTSLLLKLDNSFMMKEGNPLTNCNL